MTSRARKAALFAVALTVGTACPLMVAAQDDVPSYGHPESPGPREPVRGRIASVDNTFHITVHDDRGRTDSVRLHRGTIIHPTGLTLAPGMRVVIVGSGAPENFDANRIETPYTYDGPLVYCGPPGWWYSYGPDILMLDCPALVQKYQDP